FWLCPSVVENGEVVFSWRSSRNFFNDILYQMISASFYRGHLEWTLTNVFDGFSGNDIVLEGTTRLVPEKWSHHSFCYSEENGMLEYRMNGMLEAITYATTTSRDAGTVHQLFLGYPSTVEFCPKYTGLIDDIRIQKGYDEGRVSGYSKYNVNGGRIETRPLLASTGASLNFIEGLFDAVGETEIQVYVRSGDEFFNWTDSFPEWKPVILGQEIFDVTGRYFQVALDLFPDGSGKRTPSVSELKITYTPLPEPLPPFAVDVVAGNESVKVSWQKSVDESVGGYLLYYGTRSGEYLGINAFEGMSPVNVGDVTSFELSGLRNGTIYYITIASYSKYDGRIVGAFSKEVFARPSVTGEKYGK
ncbi:MAG: fibronectin type III domain-containing protein, partial [Treponema sp.]|nr:fibronectin type III domain-containing protein [Treponema sp.]